MSNMKKGTTSNHSFCSYIIEQEIWFVLVIGSLPSKSAVDCREVWNLMHPLWLDLCQDPLLLSYTKLYDMLAVTRVHLSPVQHCRHTLCMYLSTPAGMKSKPNAHSCTKYTQQNGIKKRAWGQQGITDSPINPIPAPTCLVLWFIALEWLWQSTVSA